MNRRELLNDLLGMHFNPVPAGAMPTADFDATWGKGFMQPDVFVTIVYNTL